MTFSDLGRGKRMGFLPTPPFLPTSPFLPPPRHSCLHLAIPAPTSPFLRKQESSV